MSEEMGKSQQDSEAAVSEKAKSADGAISGFNESISLAPVDSKHGKKSGEPRPSLGSRDTDESRIVTDAAENEQNDYASNASPSRDQLEASRNLSGNDILDANAMAETATATGNSLPEEVRREHSAGENSMHASELEGDTERPNTTTSKATSPEERHGEINTESPVEDVDERVSVVANLDELVDGKQGFTDSTDNSLREVGINANEDSSGPNSSQVSSVNVIDDGERNFSQVPAQESDQADSTSPATPPIVDVASTICSKDDRQPEVTSSYEAEKDMEDLAETADSGVKSADVDADAQESKEESRPEHEDLTRGQLAEDSDEQLRVPGINADDATEEFSAAREEGLDSNSSLSGPQSSLLMKGEPTEITGDGYPIESQIEAQPAMDVSVASGREDDGLVSTVTVPEGEDAREFGKEKDSKSEGNAQAVPDAVISSAQSDMGLSNDDANDGQLDKDTQAKDESVARLVPKEVPVKEAATIDPGFSPTLGSESLVDDTIDSRNVTVNTSLRDDEDVPGGRDPEASEESSAITDHSGNDVPNVTEGRATLENTPPIEVGNLGTSSTSNAELERASFSDVESADASVSDDNTSAPLGAIEGCSKGKSASEAEGLKAVSGHSSGDWEAVQEVALSEEESLPTSLWVDQNAEQQAESGIDAKPWESGITLEAPVDVGSGISVEVPKGAQHGIDDQLARDVNPGDEQHPSDEHLSDHQPSKLVENAEKTDLPHLENATSDVESVGQMQFLDEGKSKSPEADVEDGKGCSEDVEVVDDMPTQTGNDAKLGNDIQISKDVDPGDTEPEDCYRDGTGSPQDLDSQQDSQSLQDYGQSNGAGQDQAEVRKDVNFSSAVGTDGVGPPTGVESRDDPQPLLSVQSGDDIEASRVGEPVDSAQLCNDVEVSVDSQEPSLDADELSARLSVNDGGPLLDTESSAVESNVHSVIAGESGADNAEGVERSKTPSSIVENDFDHGHGGDEEHFTSVESDDSSKRELPSDAAHAEDIEPSKHTQGSVAEQPMLLDETSISPESSSPHPTSESNDFPTAANVGTVGEESRIRTEQAADEETIECTSSTGDKSTIEHEPVIVAQPPIQNESATDLKRGTVDESQMNEKNVTEETQASDDRNAEDKNKPATIENPATDDDSATNSDVRVDAEHVSDENFLTTNQFPTDEQSLTIDKVSPSDETSELSQPSDEKPGTNDEPLTHNEDVGDDEPLTHNEDVGDDEPLTHNEHVGDDEPLTHDENVADAKPVTATVNSPKHDVTAADGISRTESEKDVGVATDDDPILDGSLTTSPKPTVEDRTSSSEKSSVDDELASHDILRRDSTSGMDLKSGLEEQLTEKPGSREVEFLGANPVASESAGSAEPVSESCAEDDEPILDVTTEAEQNEPRSYGDVKESGDEPERDVEKEHNEPAVIGDQQSTSSSKLTEPEEVGMSVKDEDLSARAGKDEIYGEDNVEVGEDGGLCREGTGTAEDKSFTSDESTEAEKDRRHISDESTVPVKSRDSSDEGTGTVEDRGLTSEANDKILRDKGFTEDVADLPEVKDQSCSSSDVPEDKDLKTESPKNAEDQDDKKDAAESPTNDDYSGKSAGHAEPAQVRNLSDETDGTEKDDDEVREAAKSETDFNLKDSVVEPVKASESTDDSEPTLDVEPVKASELKNDSEPEKASESKDESEPTLDVEPVKVSESKDDFEPTLDVEPEKASELKDESEPVKASESKDDSEPTLDVEHVKAAESKDDSEPTLDVEPVKASELKNDSEPLKASESTDDSEPLKASESTDDSEPTLDVEPLNAAELKVDAEPAPDVEPLNAAELKVDAEPAPDVEPVRIADVKDDADSSVDVEPVKGADWKDNTEPTLDVEFVKAPTTDPKNDAEPTVDVEPVKAADSKDDPESNVDVEPVEGVDLKDGADSTLDVETGKTAESKDDPESTRDVEPVKETDLKDDPEFTDDVESVKVTNLKDPDFTDDVEPVKAADSKDGPESTVDVEPGKTAESKDDPESTRDVEPVKETDLKDDPEFTDDVEPVKAADSKDGPESTVDVEPVEGVDLKDDAEPTLDVEPGKTAESKDDPESTIDVELVKGTNLKDDPEFTGDVEPLKAADSKDDAEPTPDFEAVEAADSKDDAEPTLDVEPDGRRALPMDRVPQDESIVPRENSFPKEISEPQGETTVPAMPVDRKSETVEPNVNDDPKIETLEPTMNVDPKTETVEPTVNDSKTGTPESSMSVEPEDDNAETQMNKNSKEVSDVVRDRDLNKVDGGLTTVNLAFGMEGQNVEPTEPEHSSAYQGEPTKNVEFATGTDEGGEQSVSSSSDVPQPAEDVHDAVDSEDVRNEFPKDSNRPAPNEGLPDSDEFTTREPLDGNPVKDDQSIKLRNIAELEKLPTPEHSVLSEEPQEEPKKESEEQLKEEPEPQEEREKEPEEQPKSEPKEESKAVTKEEPKDLKDEPVAKREDKLCEQPDTIPAGSESAVTDTTTSECTGPHNDADADSLVAGEFGSNSPTLDHSYEQTKEDNEPLDSNKGLSAFATNNALVTENYDNETSNVHSPRQDESDSEHTSNTQDNSSSTNGSSAIGVGDDIEDKNSGSANELHSAVGAGDTEADIKAVEAGTTTDVEDPEAEAESANVQWKTPDSASAVHDHDGEIEINEGAAVPKSHEGLSNLEHSTNEAVLPRNESSTLESDVLESREIGGLQHLEATDEVSRPGTDPETISKDDASPSLGGLEPSKSGTVDREDEGEIVANDSFEKTLLEKQDGVSSREFSGDATSDHAGVTQGKEQREESARLNPDDRTWDSVFKDMDDADHAETAPTQNDVTTSDGKVQREEGSVPLSTHTSDLSSSWVNVSPLTDTEVEPVPDFTPSTSQTSQTSRSGNENVTTDSDWRIVSEHALSSYPRANLESKSNKQDANTESGAAKILFSIVTWCSQSVGTLFGGSKR